MNDRHRGASGKSAVREFEERMAACPTAEALNDRVIVPFVAALEAVCAARGYLLNIYGERSNLVVSTEDDAPALYDLIEAYLESREEEPSGQGG